MSKIRIGDTLATAGTTIEVPIEIYFIESNVTSLSSYDITINYTANTLDLTNSSKEAIKQTIENNSIINFIPTDTSIFIVDEIISYYVEALFIANECFIHKTIVFEKGMFVIITSGLLGYLTHLH